jgi:Fe-S-cluster containining protein
MAAFWSKGLKFSCQRCGRCCCGAPGIIYFSPTEIDALVAHLQTTQQIQREDVLRTMMRPFKDSYTALDNFDDGHCIFFNKGCTIYEVRPSQCRNFPFWRVNLQSRAEWDRISKICPGMNQGKLWTPEEICAIASKSEI